MCSIKENRKAVNEARIMAFLLALVFIALLFVGMCQKAQAMTADESYALYQQRMERYGRQVAGEIQRKHEVDIEAAKYANAIKLEEASASNTVFNVSASSDSSSVSRLTNDNTYTNSNR
jgi:hypothetical protein